MILCFLSLASQQKFAKEMNFYNKFEMKVYVIASFDEPSKRFAFVMPKIQFLYDLLNQAIFADMSQQNSSIFATLTKARYFSFCIASYSAAWTVTRAAKKPTFFSLTSEID